MTEDDVYGDTFMGQLKPEPEIEFVNDWSSLEWAVSHLVNEELYADRSGPSVISERTYEAIDVIGHYVPRLLTQYANLVELSFALTEGWEQYVKVQAPTGLYLPDHR